MINTKTDADDAAQHATTTGVSHRQRRYEQLLATVTANTGAPSEPQPASMTSPRVHLHMVAHGRFDRVEVERSMRAAVENDELVAFKRPDGPERVARATVDGRRAVIAAENARDSPDVELQDRLANEIPAP